MTHMSSKKKSKGDEAMTKLNALDTGKIMVNMMSEMQKVDIKSEKAKLNETTVEDEKGRRITYILTEEIIKARKGK